MSANSRNLAPLFGDRFPSLSQARFPSGPLKFERVLIQRSLATFTFGSLGFDLRRIKCHVLEDVKQILNPEMLLLEATQNTKLRRAENLT